jgi:anti-sigma regulatory factor (Ser/Thr protein kinase)
MSIAGPPAGFRHEALLYRSDQQLLDVVVPFLRDGAAAGEPTLVSAHPRLARLLAAALGDLHGVSFVHQEHRARPLRTVRDMYRLVTEHIAAGAPRIRMLGGFPDDDAGRAWQGWVRYEASINRFFADFPLWSICPYDLRTTSAEVLGEVQNTHPVLIAPDGGRRPSPRYRDPAAFLAERAAAETDPLQHTPPAVELIDPTPADARRALADLIEASTLTRDQAGNLTFAVSEAVLNAIRHGRRPIQLRAWAARDRVLATVRDRGSGPLDPFAGLLPRTDPADGTGLGLWLTYQLCDQVTLVTDADGFTVLLVAGSPYPDAA